MTRRLLLLPTDATRVFWWGNTTYQYFGCIVPGGPREITLKFEPHFAGIPDRTVTHQSLPQLWLWEGGTIRVLHAPPAPAVPYRLGNVDDSGGVCWGNYAAQPTHLREAISRFWESKFNLDLTPPWREHNSVGGCSERRHQCDRARIGVVCQRQHTCMVDGDWKCVREAHVERHSCGNRRHGKRCPVLHIHHTMAKRGCPCCRRRPTCECRPQCICCRNTCRCCPCRQGTCECPRITCACCRGLCGCLQRPCSHKLDEELVRIHESYLPDYLARPYMSSLDCVTDIPVAPALVWVYTVDTMGERAEYIPVRRDGAGWVHVVTGNPVEGPTR